MERTLIAEPAPQADFRILINGKADGFCENSKISHSYRSSQSLYPKPFQTKSHPISFDHTRDAAEVRGSSNAPIRNQDINVDDEGKDWNAVLSGWGIDDGLREAILDSEFDDLRYTASTAF